MSSIGNNVRMLQQLPAKALPYQQAIPVIKTIAISIFTIMGTVVAAAGLIAALVGLVVWITKREENERLTKDIKPENATQKFEDLDCKTIKEHSTIKDVINYLKKDEKSTPSVKIILISGPSDCQKSEIAQAVACETQVPIIKIRDNTYPLDDKIRGALLVASSYNSPCSILFEDFDSINSITTSLDILEKQKNKNKIAIFLTTKLINNQLINNNNIKFIKVSPPDQVERMAFFKDFFIDQPKKLEQIAQATDGWSYSQLKECLNKKGDDIEKFVQSQNSEIKKKQILAKLAAQARLGILPKSLSEGSGGPGEFLKPSAITFADIAGNKAAKDKFTEITKYFSNFEIFKAVMHPETKNVNCLAPRGVILYGPPGTGKTKLVEALANEIQFPVLSVKGSLQNMYIGESAENIRRIFTQAKSVGGPCILFIDEIDSMGKRTGGAEGASANAVTEMINTFLAETNDLEKWPHPIIIIGATNRLEAIDDALKRPGRFDAHIEVHLPDATTREEILKIHAKNFNLSQGLNFRAIAENTPDFSGAHLEELVKTAARRATLEAIQACTPEASDSPAKVVIEQRHLEDALNQVRPKRETEPPTEDPDSLRKIFRDALLSRN